jgi:NAD(P)-dependent dehydrogenase (short-subunit alcohol dehydrogenase family)
LKNTGKVCPDSVVGEPKTAGRRGRSFFMSGRLENKVALITGAGGGIGHAIAKLFVEHGATVAAISLHEESLRKWRNVTNVLPIRADICNSDDIDRMVDDVQSQLGRLDIVCNVAGINDLCYPLDETSDERWDRVLNLDLKAPFRICRRVIKGMVAQGGGVILNVGSYAAVRGNHGPSYTAAKAGLTGLSLSIAVGYANKGIRCNVINPGGVRTDIGTHSGGDYHPRGIKMFRDIVANFPVPWVCQPEDIAPIALFLCSDEAKHVNGAVVAADGGMSAC